MIEHDLKGRCGRCEAIFVIARLPMALSKVSRLLSKAACPFCGSKSPLYLARTEDSPKPE